MPGEGVHGPALDVLEAGGTLSSRITRRLEAGAGMRDVYGELADCLSAGRAF